VSDPSGKPPAPTPPPRLRPAAAPSGPPRLDRVPDGYKAPPPRAADTPARPPPAVAPGPSYGIAARQVGADAAIAAGLLLEGRLETDSPLRLYGLAAANASTGRLTLAPDGRAYALVFKKGAVEHASSSDAADGLGRFLVKKGVLTPERLVQAEGARAAAGGELVGALLATGLVSPCDIAGLLAEHGASIVSRALASDAGTFRWEPGVAPPPSAFPLGPPFAALCAAVRALDLAAVKRRLGDREERAASPMTGRVRLQDLRMNPQEARAAALLDGTRSPAELAVAHPADAATILRVALLLAELDLAAFGPVRKAVAPAVRQPQAPAPRPVPAPTPAAESPRPAAAAPPAPARPAVTPAPKPALTPAPRPTPAPAPRPAPAPALEAATLHALLAKLADRDHFEVLGVKRDTPAPQVKVAYFQLAKAYHPDAVPGSASPEVKKLCADVFAKVSEAWSVLSDEKRRAEYLEELASGGASDLDVMNILHAENVFQAGTLLVKGRKYEDARARFEEALKLNPDEPEFAIWKAWCDFLLAADRKRQHAASLGTIEAALKKNTMCLPGYLFLGQMAKLSGDLGAAEKHLRRGLALEPEHADLLRELKYLRK
jgi:curved DNA-binding protein CbpA